MFLSQSKIYNIAHNRGSRSEFGGRGVGLSGLIWGGSGFRAIVSGSGGDGFFVAGFCVFRGSRLRFVRVVCLPVGSGFGGAMALAGVDIFLIRWGASGSWGSPLSGAVGGSILAVPGSGTPRPP